MRYEDQYMNNLKNIMFNGKRELNNRTGIATYRLPSTQIIVDLQEEFPILQSKKVAWKVAADEVLWMFQKQSNNVKELGSKIWDKWADKDGSIGKTYGYQIRLPFSDGHGWYSNQVDYILSRLAANSSDRQCVIDMWNPQDLGKMNLPPCVYSSVWSIIDNRLNCMVVQRSADYPIGVPFDTTEYAMLTHLFARHLEVEPGILTHVMADSHIYINQLAGVNTQLLQYEALKTVEPKTPKLIFKEGAPTDFWHLNVDHIDIADYSPMAAIKFEVAV